MITVFAEGEVYSSDGLGNPTPMKEVSPPNAMNQ